MTFLHELFEFGQYHIFNAKSEKHFWSYRLDEIFSSINNKLIVQKPVSNKYVSLTSVWSTSQAILELKQTLARISRDEDVVVVVVF